MARTKKQTELPGIEKPTHKELDVLMELRAEKTSLAATLRQEIGDINEKILAKARELKLTVYRDETAVPPLVLTIAKGAPKVKVSPAKGISVDESVADDDAEEGDE